MNVTDPNFKWVRPECTNVQDTWKKFGWIPPSQDKAPDAQQPPELPVIAEKLSQ